MLDGQSVSLDRPVQGRIQPEGRESEMHRRLLQEPAERIVLDRTDVPRDMILGHDLPGYHRQQRRLLQCLPHLLLQFGSAQQEVCRDLGKGCARIIDHDGVEKLFYVLARDFDLGLNRPHLRSALTDLLFHQDARAPALLRHSGGAVRIDGRLEHRRCQHCVSQPGEVLEGAGDGEVKPLRVVEPAQARVVSDEAARGVLEHMRIEMSGVCDVAIVQDQAFKIGGELLPLLLGDARALLVDKPVVGDVPVRAAFGHGLPVKPQQSGAGALDSIGLADHDRQVKRAERNSELVMLVASDGRRHGGEVRVRCEAGHLRVAPCIRDHGAHFPGKVGVPRLEHWVVRSFARAVQWSITRPSAPAISGT
jgi:hypothetical protein